MKFKLLFSYRFLLFILSVLGVYLQLTKHGGFGMMLYYTILSNMLVMFFMGDMVWRMVRGRSTQTQGYLRMKGAVTMSIMTTLCWRLSRHPRSFIVWKTSFVITSFL